MAIPKERKSYFRQQEMIIAMYNTSTEKGEKYKHNRYINISQTHQQIYNNKIPQIQSANITYPQGSIQCTLMTNMDAGPNSIKKFLNLHGNIKNKFSFPYSYSATTYQFVIIL